MENNIYKEIGNRLREARQKQRYTISSIAKKTGISQSSITKYEKGQDRIPLETLIKICNAINIPFTRLFPEELDGILLDFYNKNALKQTGTYDKILVGFTGKSNIFYDKSKYLEYFFTRKNKNCSFVIEIADDSMYPVIKKNSYVGIDYYEFFEGGLLEGQIYLFNLQGIGLILKRIIEIEGKKDKIVIVSEDLKIPKKVLTLSKIYDINYFMQDNSLNIIKETNSPFKNPFKFRIDLDYLIGKAVWVMQDL